LYSFIHVYLCYLHRSLLAARLLLRFRSYGYAAPRDLRSFPTRRSSDLGAGGPVRPRTWISAAGTDGGVSHHQLDGHDDVGPHPRVDLLVQGVDQLLGDAAEVLPHRRQQRHLGPGERGVVEPADQDVLRHGPPVLPQRVDRAAGHLVVSGEDAIDLRVLGQKRPRRSSTALDGVVTGPEPDHGRSGPRAG